MIEVNNLTFIYPKATNPAIQGMSFNVDRGELFGFLGPSGAGKSTTQKILIRLLKSYTGRVAVLGRELDQWNSEYYERIGVVFEFPNHFLKLTGPENLAYFSRLYSGPTESPERLLELVGLAGDGNVPVSQYSKGMKTRLSFARCLLHDPEILFLDEPTAGLDPVNARRIKEHIKAMSLDGKTVFLTTHDMSVADQLCDRVAFVVDGRITLIGRPQDLKLRYGKATIRVEYKDGGGDKSRDFGLEGLADDGEFLALLRGHRIETMHSLEASLEEVFIRVTGRELL